MKPCKKCGKTDRNKFNQCRSCKNEAMRNWRQKNKGKVKYYNRSRNSGWNKLQNRKRASAWNKKNPANAHNKRAELNGYEGTFTNAEWKILCVSTGNKCLKCEAHPDILTVDHVIPLSRGGTNNINNIQPLCKACNAKKHTNAIDYRPSKGLLLPQQGTLW